MPKEYTTILLDWDGCIAQTLDMWLRAYQHTFALFEHTIADETITHTVFGDWDAPQRLGIGDVEKFYNILLEYAEREFAATPLYPGAKDVLSSLKKDNKTLLLLPPQRGVLCNLQWSIMILRNM